MKNSNVSGGFKYSCSVADLDTAVKIMGKLQRNVDLTDEEVEDIVAFFGSLTSDIPDEVKKSPFKS